MVCINVFGMGETPVRTFYQTFPFSSSPVTRLDGVPFTGSPEPRYRATRNEGPVSMATTTAEPEPQPAAHVTTRLDRVTLIRMAEIIRTKSISVLGLTP